MVSLGRSLRAFSVRQAVQLESHVLAKLRGVSDGLGMGDIVSSGRVKVRCDPSAVTRLLVRGAHLMSYRTSA